MKKILLGVVLALVLVFSSYVRLVNAGWLLLMGGFVYSFGAILCHLVVHGMILTLCKTEAFHGTALKTVFVSHALLVAAILFQYDFDDWDGGFAIERLLGIEMDWSLGGFGHLWNIAVLVPVLVSWLRIDKRMKIR